MGRFQRLIGVTALVLIAARAQAANRVIVESRHFQPSQAACSVGVFLSNDVPVQGLTIPLEFRRLDSAYIVGGETQPPFLWSMPAANRLGRSPLGVSHDTSGGVMSSMVTMLRYAEPVSQPCGGPVSGSYATAGRYPDGISPDAVFAATISVADPRSGANIYLLPGADSLHTESASLLLRFNVQAAEGCFVIDTCCVRPANHLLYIDNETRPIIPDFKPGYISIGRGICPPGETASPGGKPPAAGAP